jgi:superoxide reductase
MKNELILKKCNSCGALVKIFTDCTCENCGIKCCEKEMQLVIPNSTDGAVEKHIPQYEQIDDEIFVKLNHPMEKEHYIEWIALVKDNREEIIYLYPEQNAECRFKYIKGSTIYAYCNKHGLWKNDVK